MAQTIALRLAMMLIYVAIGFVLYKRKLMTDQGTKDLGKLLIYVVLPCAIVKSYMLERTGEMTSGLLISFLLAAICLVTSVLLSKLIYRGRKPIEEFGAAFSNAGFMGIPLVSSAIGDQAVCYTAAFVAVLNILQLSYGVFMMTGSRRAISLKKIMTIPVLIAFVIGVILYFMPFRLPEFFSEILTAISGMNAPVAMLIIGAYLAQVSIKEMLTRAQGYLVTAVRLILVPAVTALILWAIPVGTVEMKLTVLILAAAPIGSNVAIYAQLYDKDYKIAVEEVVLSTVLSVATMPLIIGVCENIL